MELTGHDGPCFPLVLQPRQQGRVAALKLLRNGQQNHIFSRAVAGKGITPARYLGLCGLDQRCNQGTARLHGKALAINIRPAVIGAIRLGSAKRQRGLARSNNDVAPDADGCSQLGMAREIKPERT